MYVMNSVGYCTEHLKQWSDESNSYVCWTPDCIIDTSSWTAEFIPHEMKGWMSKYAMHSERLKQLMPFFM